MIDVVGGKRKEERSSRRNVAIYINDCGCRRLEESRAKIIMLDDFVKSSKSAEVAVDKMGGGRSSLSLLWRIRGKRYVQQITVLLFRFAAQSAPSTE